MGKDNAGPRSIARLEGDVLTEIPKLIKSKASQTNKSDEVSGLKQQITFLSEELQETRRKLLKVQDEKKKENHDQAEKIKILINEKMVLQEEVSGLKKTIQQKVSIKENKELAAKKVAKLEADLRESRARLESEQKVSSKFSDSNKQLLRDVSKKETELRTLRNHNYLLLEKLSRKETENQKLRSYNNLAENRIAELEEQVRENQSRFDIILNTARSPQLPFQSQSRRAEVTAQTRHSHIPSHHHLQGSSITGQSPVPSPHARPAVKARPDLQKQENTNDVLIAMAVAKVPELTAEEASGFIKIILERSPGIGTRQILAGVEELWKNSLGAVGGETGVVVCSGSQFGGPGQAGVEEEEEEEEEECSVCLEPLKLGNTKELSPCGHRFHLNCIQVNLGLVSSLLSLTVYISRTGSILRGELAAPAPTAGTTWWM